MSISSIRLEEFPSAKLKVEQFFNQWLLTDGSDFVQIFLDKALLATKTASSSSSSSISSSSGSGSGLSLLTSSLGNDISDLISTTSESSSSRPPSSPTKRSPKKRTQSEIYSNSTASFRNSGFVGNNTSHSGGSQLPGSLRGLSMTLQPPSDGLQSLLIDEGGYGMIKHDVSDGSLLGSDGSAGVVTADPSSIKGNIITSSASSMPSQTASRRRANFDSIPVFFVPGKTQSRCAMHRRIGKYLYSVHPYRCHSFSS